MSVTFNTTVINCSNSATNILVLNTLLPLYFTCKSTKLLLDEADWTFGYRAASESSQYRYLHQINYFRKKVKLCRIGVSDQSCHVKFISTSHFQSFVRWLSSLVQKLITYTWATKFLDQLLLVYGRPF